MIQEDIKRSEEIQILLEKNGFLKNEIGIAIIDLNEPEVKIFGYNMDHFIYPASVYKVFIGAEVLCQIEFGVLSLDQILTIKSPNDVDKDARIFPGDTRKLLNAGDEITIDYLLNLMLTRSDNTASNSLIDIVGRESITKNIIHQYHWHGSEVTRKFLDRIKDDKSYRYSETTKTCARHMAEFFYLVETEQLISSFVSRKLKEYMLQWNKGGRRGLSISEYVSYYRKGGWLETNLWKYGFKKALKSIFKKRWAVIRWSNDVGVVKGEKSHYIISVFSVNKQINPYKKFPMEKLAKVIYDFMENKI